MEPTLLELVVEAIEIVLDFTKWIKKFVRHLRMKGTPPPPPRHQESA